MLNVDRGSVVDTSVPAEAGVVVDVAPITIDGTLMWLLLDEAGRIGRWHIATGTYEHLATTTVPTEDGHEPRIGRTPRRRLHASVDGAFAAVVNDYGRFGEVLDLRAGRITMTLDNEGYQEATVPFSLVFADHAGRTVVVHRTGWNRLDVSVAGTGELLTERSPTSYGQNEPRPEHYLDYFHGALYLSPDGRRILDDGWIWHPVGFPSIWSIERWLTDNVWESEDGPTSVCGREYYWDSAMTWIDSTRVAVEGIGDDDAVMQPGARIFDTNRTEQGDLWRLPTAVEVVRVQGPAERFFSDGTHLFNSDAEGLHMWNPTDGVHLATMPEFSPTHHHREGGEFLQLTPGMVRTWALR
jgi:hypothetical protein